MSVEPSVPTTVLSTMFDAQDDGEERLGGAHTITASRPAECGCHNERRFVPLKPEQF
jgi:hypothetical protein